MKKQTKQVKNDYGEAIGNEYNETSESVAMFQEHLTVQEEPTNKDDYKGVLDAEIIIKTGISKTGRVWVYGKSVKTNALVLRSFDPAQFLSLLQGINGIYAEVAKDTDGFPIGKELTVTPQELNERLKGCRVCTLDNKPVFIRP